MRGKAAPNLLGAIPVSAGGFMHWIVPAVIVGLGREYFLKKGWIPEEEGTKQEKKDLATRGWVLSAFHTIFWFAMLVWWLKWFAPGLWDQYWVVSHSSG
jgi:hypothetical protein